MNLNNLLKKTSSVCVLLVSGFLAFSAEKYSADQQQGFDAYRKHDWTTSIFFLRKAVSVKSDPETLYMLVLSEIQAGEYKTALSDCDTFLGKYSASQYAPYVQFQKGRALHYLGKNEDAVLVLSDFCHQNPDNELYSSALYWIAESFYAEYNFDSARALYERISIDFPSSEKVTDARYRIEMIAQREREEKLIYLLKVTGEENLAAREDYERQLRLYQTEDKMGLRKALADAENRILDLEARLENEKRITRELTTENANLEKLASEMAVQSVKPVDEKPAEAEKTETEVPKTVFSDVFPVRISDPEVEALKRKAKVLQFVLDEKSAEGVYD